MNENTIRENFLNAVIDLLDKCNHANIFVRDVQPLFNGFKVLFEDWDGDAILHDLSHGRLDCSWETLGFPWDKDDISVHDTDTLVELLKAYKFIMTS